MIFPVMRLVVHRNISKLRLSCKSNDKLEIEIHRIHIEVRTVWESGLDAMVMALQGIPLKNISRAVINI